MMNKTKLVPTSMNLHVRQCRGRALGGDMPRPSCELLLERLTAQGGATGQGVGGKVGFKRKLSLFTLYTVLSELFFFFF